MSAGLRHSVALTVSGNIYCWGHAKKGQCGVIDDSTPVSRFNKPVNGKLKGNSWIFTTAYQYHILSHFSLETLKRVTYKQSRPRSGSD